MVGLTRSMSHRSHEGEVGISASLGHRHPNARRIRSVVEESKSCPPFSAALAISLPSSTPNRSEEQTSELQSLMRSSYAVFCLKNKTQHNYTTQLVTTNTNSLTNQHT